MNLKIIILTICVYCCNEFNYKFVERNDFFITYKGEKLTNDPTKLIQLCTQSGFGNLTVKEHETQINSDVRYAFEISGKDLTLSDSYLNLLNILETKFNIYLYQKRKIKLELKYKQIKCLSC